MLFQLVSSYTILIHKFLGVSLGVFGGGVAKVTDSFLRSLKAFDGSRPKKIALMDGLSVFHYPSGKVSFVYRYSVLGKQKDMTLGEYGKAGLSLAVANQKRDQCNKWLAEGRDPSIEMKLQREKSLAPITVRDALEKWLEEYASKKRTNAAKHRQQFEKWIFPYHGNTPLERMKQEHWISCFTETQKKKAFPVAAGYVLQNLKQALLHCKRRKYEFDLSQIELLTINDVGGKKQAKKERTLIQHDGLDWSELTALMKWLKADSVLLNDYYFAMVYICIVFGCRTQEIRLASPNEFCFKTGLWTVPKEHSKGGREIIRPIPEFIKDWLQNLIIMNSVALQSATKQKVAKEDTASQTAFVLGELKNPEAVSMWCRGLHKRIGISAPFTAHDLRRTTATGWACLGVAPHVIESELGHSLGGVAGIYNRAHYVPEKAAALEMWISRLEELRIDNVSILPIKRPA